MTHPLRKKAEELLKQLPEKKLNVAFDFLNYLNERGEAEDILKLQMTSRGYQEWLGDENDIYDKVFGGAVSRQ
jgi:hypothetical protein